MTEQTPTDAEILELWKSYNPLHGIQSFARAVLAKWGSPVVAGEPQPTNAQAGAVPLTDEQIKDLQDDDVFFGTCRQIVRAIEAAHGIGETP